MVCSASTVLGVQIALCMKLLVPEAASSVSEQRIALASDRKPDNVLQLTPAEITCLVQFKDFPKEYSSAYLDPTCFVGPPANQQRPRSLRAPLVDFAPLDFSSSILRAN